jgi:hypothetical protein
MKIVEIAILILIGFFALDFLPRNYNEYQRICWQEWSTDTKQYQTCMDPYFAQTILDKYAIGAGVVAMILTPIFYINLKKIFL